MDGLEEEWHIVSSSPTEPQFAAAVAAVDLSGPVLVLLLFVAFVGMDFSMCLKLLAFDMAWSAQLKRCSSTSRPISPLSSCLCPES